MSLHYVILDGWYYEGYQVDGVFDSEHEAVAFALTQEELHGPHWLELKVFDGCKEVSSRELWVNPRTNDGGED